MVEKLHRLGPLDDLAGVHHRDLVGRLGDHAHVVGDEDHGHPVLAAQVVEQIEDQGLNGDVEGRGGLVGDEQLGSAGDGQGDHHPLAHPTREAMGVVAQMLGRGREANLLQQLDRAPARRLPTEVQMPAEGLGDLASDRQRGI